MITKTNEQDTDRAGKRLLRDAFEPLGWIVNDVQEDFCIDSNVQVFDGQSPTGTWFHVQLKSSENPGYSSDNSFISQSLRVDHARHFALELRQPMFLIVADVMAKRLFWTCPQMDLPLLAQLRTPLEQESITVRVPTSRQLPDDVSGLLSALSRAFAVLSCRELTMTPTGLFAESLMYSVDPIQLRVELQNKSDMLKLQNIAFLCKEGKETAARERADLLTRDPDASVEVRFWASIQVCNIDYAALIISGRPQEELSRNRIEHTVALQRLVKSGAKPFKYYALIARRAAEFEALAHENFSLSMLQLAHLQKGGNPFLVWKIYARRAWLSKALTAKYNQCVRLARYAAASGDPSLLGRALTSVTNALAVYVATLRTEGEIELLSAFLESALQVSKLAAWASRETYDENGIAMAVLSSVLVMNSKDSPTYNWAEETAESIVDQGIREETLQALKRVTRRWKGEKLEGDPVGDTAWHAVQNMASASGIDLSDENSPLVRSLRIAIKDDTPDRVLKECEHLLVSSGAIGPLAIRVNTLFNMKTACHKVVHCKLHNFHIEERDLDSAYFRFKTEHCAECKDRQPRPDDWKFSGWITPEEAAFLVSLVGTPFDMRLVEED